MTFENTPALLFTFKCFLTRNTCIINKFAILLSLLSLRIHLLESVAECSRNPGQHLHREPQWKSGLVVCPAASQEDGMKSCHQFYCLIVRDIVSYVLMAWLYNYGHEKANHVMIGSGISAIKLALVKYQL